MKVLVNIGCIFIMLLSFSSMTSAQQQKRPSQRSLAFVLAKIKEKKSGKDKEHKQQCAEKIGRGKDK